MIRTLARVFVAAGLLAAAGAGAAQAAPFTTLDATYDGFLQDTVFTITNGGTHAETVTLTTSLGPITSVVLPGLLAAGATEQYTFNQVNGGFGTDPFSLGTPDTTTFALAVNFGAGTLTSAAFSPLANLTGSTVDFLGTACQGFGPCGVAMSGTVASIDVPEPMSLALLGAGLAGIATVRRRAR